ncbi:hypothetical protein SO802_003546 [Lithocarpus litseifolius]|uniref:Uncharacterized protein n=1 Tax=Lithocarpus litseifolius TaxID=425828 RepID=A0AAW2E0C6_9ROSI
MAARMFKATIDGHDGFFDEAGGVNLNLRQVTADGNSILHVAAKSGNAQITKKDFVGKLLEACPSAIVEADDFGWIPLHYAAHFGNAKFVNLFLKKNVSLVHIKDKAGMSALHISAKEGHVDLTRTLIIECPDSCELLDNKDRTSLHLAAERGNSKVVKVFLQTLASEDLIYQQDKEGNTPFHLAAMEGRYALY